MSVTPRDYLQYSRILEPFPLAIRNAIYAKSEYRTYKKGDFVYRDGDKGPYFMGCLMSGRLAASVTSREGKQFLVSTVEKGEMFGAMSMFDQMPRTVDIHAEADSTVMILQPDDFIPHLLACPEAMLGLMKLVSRRLRGYVRSLELLALQTVRQKVGRYLIHVARDFGTEHDGKITFDLRDTQTDIGMQLGISRESVNKHINAFVEEGLILYSGDSVTLCDIEGLKQAIGPSGND